MPFLEVSQGCGPEHLAVTVPSLVNTVVVLQWRGAHSFWPCFVNIVEHSECSGGSPGALYINNIIFYYTACEILSANMGFWSANVQRYYAVQQLIAQLNATE